MKKVLVIAICCIALLFTALSAAVGYAYFSKKEIYEGMMGAEIELLFDRLTAETLADYQTSELGGTENADASWGTLENPYVISNIKHLYNLAELQKLGYFDRYYISLNETDADGNYIPGADGIPNMPYFLVCTPEGKPVTIDGQAFGNNKISSIGTEEFPFIGSVKGAFVDGSCEVEGKTSTVSAICDVEVLCDPADVDAGLFGYIGHLGTAGAEGTEFVGEVSVVSNLVISDVKVTVDSSLFETVTEFIIDHIFSFSEIAEGQDQVPHENHHIGILAGHISYAQIDLISIYYSSDDSVAIDLKDATPAIGGVEPNYLSVSGVIGYIDNMNPTVGDSGIVAGSGESNQDISYTGVGGGGLLSGNKAGYMLASEFFTKYGFAKLADGTTLDAADGSIVIKDAVSDDGKMLCQEWVRERILWGTENTGRFYFYDGVFTFALSGTADNPSKDTIDPTWGEGQDKSFSIGETDTSKWVTNYSKGNNAVAAFISEIKSYAALNDAINKQKKLFILVDNGESIFLMDLSQQSTPNENTQDPEQRFYTNGLTQYFGDSDFVNSIIQSLEGIDESDLVFNPDFMSSDYKDAATLAAALKNGTVKTINVGISSSDKSVEEIREQYNITPASTTVFTYIDETGAAVGVSGTDIVDYYNYANASYTGYFYYTSASGTGLFDWMRTYYKYYWQPKDGEAVQLNGNNDTTTPANYFTATSETWETEKVYTRGDYTGVVVNNNNSTFYDTGNTARPSGQNLIKPIDKTYKFVYRNMVDGKYYYSVGDVEVNLNTTSTGTTETQRPLYSATAKTGGASYTNLILVDRYPNYKLTHGDNALRLMKLVYWAFGTRYTIWNGSDAEAANSDNFSLFLQNAEVSNSPNATIRFNADGSCNIGFSIVDDSGSATRYVRLSGEYFNSASGITNETKMHIFAVEGTQDLNYGRVTFDPVSGTGESFNIGEYVFFANKDAGAAEANGKYSVISLEELGWKNGLGQTLTEPDLAKKFSLTDGITFGLQLNVLNGSLGSGGFIQAPVGSAGVIANIPQSCVAFRINKADGEKKIRVIVAVPTSEYSSEEGDFALDLTYEHYFNLWQLEEAGESTIQTFEAGQYLDRFALPASYPYIPGTSPSQGRYTTVNKGSMNPDTKTLIPGTTDYYCSLNGDRVLIAYEFTVSDAGIYVMGMSGYNAANDEYSENGVPMEIVYFSADGVASTGRDGMGGSQLGSIDYVYDYNNKIITVTDTPSSTDENGNEDYNNYYPSYVIAYFDNTLKENGKFVAVNDELIKIRRWVDSAATTDIKSTINFSAASSDNKTDAAEQYAKIAAYARLSDIVNKEYSSR